MVLKLTFSSSAKKLKQHYYVSGCIVSVESHIYCSQWYVLYFLAPSGPPNNVKGFILNFTSIKVNWTATPEVTGYVVEYYYTGSMKKIVTSTTEKAIILTDFSKPSTLIINVYSYIDIPSVNSTIRFKFDGELQLVLFIVLF